MGRRVVPDVVRGQDLLTVAPDASVREAARLMTDRRIGAALVTERGRLVGIITERDVMARVVAEGLDPDTTQVWIVMTADPKTVAPDERSIDALKLMYEGGFRHLPVVQGSRPVAILSLRDFLAAEFAEMHAELEEEEVISQTAR
jgi:CBS domain-containing protein